MSGLENLTGDNGGDVWALSAPIVEAIARAFREDSTDDEIREAFGMGDWRVVTPEKRERYAAYFAEKTYRAIVEAMTRAIVGDFKAGLSKAQRAEIAARLAQLAGGGGGWDGVLPADVQDEIDYTREMMNAGIDAFIEEAIADGYEGPELDAEVARMRAEIEDEVQAIVDNWKADNGIDEDAGGMTPAQLEAERAQMVADAKNAKKPAFEALGSLVIPGFMTLKPEKENPLYPRTRPEYGHGGGVPVVDGSLDWVSLAFAGVAAGFGEWPVDLPVDGSGPRLVRLVEGPGFRLPDGTADELATVRESIAGVRLAWLYNVACDFELSGAHRDCEVNAFPGLALAHLREEFEIREIDAYTRQQILVARSVLAYVDAAGADAVLAGWGRSPPVGGYALDMAGLAYLGGDHVDRLYLSRARDNFPTGPETVAALQAGALGVDGWAFDFPALGMDCGASAVVIEGMFPRRHRVALPVPVGGLGGPSPDDEIPRALEWIGWDDWGESVIEMLYQNYDFAIRPPREKPAENVRFKVKFSPLFVESLNG